MGNRLHNLGHALAFRQLNLDDLAVLALRVLALCFFIQNTSRCDKHASCAARTLRLERANVVDLAQLIVHTPQAGVPAHWTVGFARQIHGNNGYTVRAGCGLVRNLSVLLFFFVLYADIQRNPVVKPLVALPIRRPHIHFVVQQVKNFHHHDESVFLLRAKPAVATCCRNLSCVAVDVFNVPLVNTLAVVAIAVPTLGFLQRNQVTMARPALCRPGGHRIVNNHVPRSQRCYLNTVQKAGAVTDGQLQRSERVNQRQPQPVFDCVTPLPQPTVDNCL